MPTSLSTSGSSGAQLAYYLMIKVLCVQSQKAHWQIERNKNRHAVSASGGNNRNEPRLRPASRTEGLPKVLVSSGFLFRYLI